MNQGVHNQDLHLNNPPFELKLGMEIFIPSGVAMYFIRPYRRIGRGSLPKVACLQQAARREGGSIYSFATRPTHRGFKLFLPDDLKAGDRVIVVWKASRSAAAVLSQDFKAYQALYLTPELPLKELHKD